MKIISGKYKGRVLKGYDINGTRPTMDRVKESVFGMIQNYLNNATVLDLFSGSGSYGIEALSNGANKVYFNDKNPLCIKVIKDNLMNVNEDYIITNFDYLKALDYYKKQNIKFDLVFLDPPYKNHIINEILNYLLDNDLLNNKALVICEITSIESFDSDQLELYKSRRYGDKEVLIYRKS